MRRWYWLHPVCFAWLAPITLLAYNIETAPPFTAVRSIIVSTALALALFLLLRSRFDGSSAVFLTSVILATSLVFGNLLHLDFPVASGDMSPVLHGSGVLLFLALIAAFLWATSRLRTPPEWIHVFLMTVGLVAVGWNAGRIATYERLTRIPLRLPGLASELEQSRPVSRPVRFPDIYYVIVDGYGRDDVLGETYGLDNSTFIQTLQQRGFFVAPGARSNYAQTSLSLASSMNLGYLHELADLKDEGSSQSSVARLFRYNEVVTLLESFQYTIVSIPVAYNRTLLPNADVSYAIIPRSPNSFESLLLENSILWSPLVLARASGLDIPYPGYSGRRESIRAGLAALQATIPQPGPKFVFAHLMVPHPPFVFDRAGGGMDAPYPYREQDGDQFPGDRQDYLAGYKEQVLFTNQAIVDFLDELDGAGQTEAIVIIQGDHGPGSRFDWLDAEQTDLRERYAILNALRIPDLGDDALELSASPVNTFRVVFNHLFGASYLLLEDRSFFSPWSEPYAFVEVPESELMRR